MRGRENKERASNLRAIWVESVDCVVGVGQSLTRSCTGRRSPSTGLTHKHAENA